MRLCRLVHTLCKKSNIERNIARASAESASSSDDDKPIFPLTLVGELGSIDSAEDETSPSLALLGVLTIESRKIGRALSLFPFLVMASIRPEPTGVARVDFNSVSASCHSFRDPFKAGPD